MRRGSVGGIGVGKEFSPFLPLLSAFLLSPVCLPPLPSLFSFLYLWPLYSFSPLWSCFSYTLVTKTEHYGPETRWPDFESELCCFLVVKPTGASLTSICFHFLPTELGVTPRAPLCGETNLSICGASGTEPGHLTFVYSLWWDEHWTSMEQGELHQNRRWACNVSYYIFFFPLL